MISHARRCCIFILLSFSLLKAWYQEARQFNSVWCTKIVHWVWKWLKVWGLCPKIQENANLDVGEMIMACREAMQLKSAQFKIDQGYNDEKKFIWFIIWYKHLWYLSTWAMYNFVTVQGDSLQNQEKKNSRLHHVIKIDAQATQLILLCTTTTNLTSSCCLKDYRSIFKKKDYFSWSAIKLFFSWFSWIDRGPINPLVHKFHERSKLIHDHSNKSILMIPCFFEVQNVLLSQNNYTSSLLHNCVNELSFMHRLHRRIL